jgi:DNA-binding XRE family transcriptional regulator
LQRHHDGVRPIGVTNTAAPERRPATPLARYLKAKRDEAGLSQEAMADRISFAQSAISGWESGRSIPPALALAAIDQALPGASLTEMVALIAKGEQP